jgi:hypothetical protein
MNTVRITILLIALIMIVEGRAQINESFGNPDFSTYSQWTGQIDHFMVNANQRLQLYAPAAGQSHVVATYESTDLDNREWRFWIKLGFAPSDNNQARIYLASSGTSISYTGTVGSGGVQGYFLRFGEAGSADAIRLYRDNGSGSSTLILSGAEGQIASSFEISVRVIRQAGGEWQLFVDPSGGDFFQLQATANDNTFNASVGFGIVCNYTSGNVTNFQFDDIYFGPIIVDTTPPIVTGATALSANSLQIHFSEAIDQDIAAQTSNYNLVGQGFPASAVPSPNSVLLTFANEFTQNTAQTLLVSGVEDIAGNVMTPASVPFTWFVPAVAGWKDVIFNEIMPDPTPVVGLPDAEFIELYNTSDEIFDLGGWVLVNTTTPRTLSSHILQPGGYVLLCDANNAQLFSGLPVMPITSFVALVNGSDSLTLLNPQGDIVDYLSYNSNWHDIGFADGGYTLELINPGLNCHTKSNWRTSQNPAGGTPAAVNSVFNPAPDLTLPEIIGFSLVDLSEIKLILSKAIENPDVNFTSSISGESEVIWVEKQGDEILRFVFSEPLEYGIEYTLYLSEVIDCAGNSATNLSYSFAIGFPVEIGDVIINEIMAAPSSNTLSPNAEYVEVFNRTDKLIDISGVKFQNGYLTQSVQIEPGGYVVFTRSADVALFEGLDNVFGMTSFPQLTNGGMSLNLFGPSSQTLDKVDYTDKWYIDSGTSSGGYSLELINPFAPCSDASNWRASKHPSGGTPGKVNSVYNTTPDTSLPQALYVLAPAPDNFIVVFNKPLDPGLSSDFSLVLYEYTGSSTSISSIQPIEWNHNPEEAVRLAIILSNPLVVGRKYLLKLNHVSDCNGNAANSEVIISAPEQAMIGDVVVNEILSNPRTGGKDFVEIYNRSGRNVTLQGWALAREVNGIVESIRVFTEEPLLYLSGEYLCISNDISNIAKEYPLSVKRNLWLTPSMPAYNNDNGTVVLLDFLQQEIDKVTYDKDMHFALLRDVKGVSFERVDPNRPSDDFTNWHSAAQTVGFATPGYQNSQFGDGQSQADFAADPEMFSPDNDGHNDLVHFRFKMESPGFVGTITIYDSEGRIVRKLVRNELLAIEGAFSWDGIDDRNAKASIGIYMAVFEFFSPDGKRGMAKAACVLAHTLN